MTALMNTVEYLRLQQDSRSWKTWGPYVSDRSWGTVREDDSGDGNAWRYLPHDQARSRAYRWGEDGIGGISDDHQLLCFSLALWNGRDPILKERFFGLDNNEGNHGEDAKDYWFYLDATPTHSFARMLYKYPQTAFPYLTLVDKAHQRGREDPEFELADTEIFAGNRYFDVELQYAKAGPEDICIRIVVTNRGPDVSELSVLPTLWFRNTWSFGPQRSETIERPSLTARGASKIDASHERLGHWVLECADGPSGGPDLLFTENETNTQRIFGEANCCPYVKDGIHEFVINGREEAVNPRRTGTKASARYCLTLAPGASASLRLRLRRAAPPLTEVTDLTDASEIDRVLALREMEANSFYDALQHTNLDADTRLIQRQAWAGMLWSKQWYAYSIPAWQHQSSPDRSASAHSRNRAWNHFEASDVISMPDKWEYPWFAAWDLGFHSIALAYIDPMFAKEQLLLMVSERFQHPNGAVSAYEWNFDDANPPVLARAAYRVFQIEKQVYGREDRAFLELMFHKLALNFAWWVNRKDQSGDNIFGGGFLGLDNIGVFDRSQPLPTGGYLEQSDGTSWIAMFSLDLATIALELSRDNPTYRQLVCKYVIHFMYVAQAMNGTSDDAQSADLWDDEDGFYYDRLRVEDRVVFLRVRSMVGLIPLFAAALQPREARDPELAEWFVEYVKHRPQLALILDQFNRDGQDGIRMLSLVDRHRLEQIVKRLFDSAEFLSDYGIRSLSKVHEAEPYSFAVGSQSWNVRYVPAESDSAMFGGNSNWRGPIWFPLNYFLITSLRRWHRYFGDARTFEFPTGSGVQKNLREIADELSYRLLAIFRQGPDGKRPVHAGALPFSDGKQGEPILFYEYFHGDTGRGVGASHQTGWTGLVAALIQELGQTELITAAPRPYSLKPVAPEPHVSL